VIRRPPRSTLSASSAASDVYKRQPSMKSMTHHSTLHLSFKIKCCVDRLRPPAHNGLTADIARCPKCANRRHWLAYSHLVGTRASPCGEDLGLWQKPNYDTFAMDPSAACGMPATMLR